MPRPARNAPMPALRPLSIDRTSPAPEQIHRALRAAIISLELAPGSPLSEGEVAQAYSVSRTPVREAFARLRRWGLVDAYRLHHAETGRYTWWDYRAGNFHKNFGTRIDHLLATPPLARRTLWAEIDREARKGKPIPSDHAPLLIDVDEAGTPLDAGWASADARIAARLRAG